LLNRAVVEKRHMQVSFEAQPLSRAQHREFKCSRGLLHGC
jgi:hypothetical protein